MKFWLYVLEGFLNTYTSILREEIYFKTKILFFKFMLTFDEEGNLSFYKILWVA